MLGAAENERLCRVTGSAPMGQMVRRYWMPACKSAELVADGTPLRLRLLGEDLVAFRDTAGAAGLIGARCPHRLASLALGRNEEGGLRCIYHGWKFAVDGTCSDMPTEPAESTYKDRLRTRSYPVREQGGFLWTYMGPAGSEPPFRNYDWTLLPDDQRVVFRAVVRANFMQCMEGSVDSAHSWFLHRGSVNDWKQRSTVSSDTAPRLEAEDTSYGFRYAAIRVVDEHPDEERYIRVTLFAVPITIFIPRPLNPKLPAHVQIFVPIDDEHTMFCGIFFSQNGAPIDAERTLTEVGMRTGIDLDERGFRRASPDNSWLQDRAAMRNDSYVGIEGVLQQDMAVHESIGPRADRRHEHLGTSDVAVIRLRRRMLDALQTFEERGALVGDGPIPFERIRSEQKVIRVDEPWQSVGAYAGEFATR